MFFRFLLNFVPFLVFSFSRVEEILVDIRFFQVLIPHSPFNIGNAPRSAAFGASGAGHVATKQPQRKSGWLFYLRVARGQRLSRETHHTHGAAESSASGGVGCISPISNQQRNSPLSEAFAPRCRGRRWPHWTIFPISCIDDTQ